MADEKISSWYDMQVPKVEVLILNFRTFEKCTLPHFMERMDQLKVLIITTYLFHEVDLNSVPGGGYLSSLRRIRLENVSIVSLGTSLMQMRNLRKMSLIRCNIVKAYDVPQHIPNLVELEVERCKFGEELVAVLCNILNLKKLSVSSSVMYALPEGIGRMTNLEVLRLPFCTFLQELPECIGRMTNLEVLRLPFCTDLKKLPECIGNLHKLRLLDISFCSKITRMPERMGELCALKTIDMRGCRKLKELPALVKDLRDLEYVICREQIAHQWESLKTRLPNLKITVDNTLLDE